MKNSIILSMIAMLTAASACYAEGLDALVAVGKSHAEIQKAYAEETKSYDMVKKGVDVGAIKIGQTTSDVLSGYGGPVVMVREYGTGREMWIYKPSKTTFFDGEKIYLIFDNNGRLDEIKAKK